MKYDKEKKATEQTWKVGDHVLLQDTSVKPGSSRVITKQRFVGPYVMKDIVVGCPDIGQAYHLINEVTGKELRHFASNDRLKQYNVNRAEFNVRLPSLQTCLLYTSPSPRDRQKSRMPSSA